MKLASFEPFFQTKKFSFAIVAIFLLITACSANDRSTQPPAAEIATEPTAVAVEVDTPLPATAESTEATIEAPTITTEPTENSPTPPPTEAMIEPTTTLTPVSEIAEPSSDEVTSTASMAVDEPLPIFDTHLHYNLSDWNVYFPPQAIAKMEQANVFRALVSSSPDDGTRMLHAVDPDRIVPFLRPYHDTINSGNWMRERDVLPYFDERLETLAYHGIGEFHLHFDGDANEPIMRDTARLAVEQGLYLHIHSDAEAIRTVLGYEPTVKIIWAHAGLSEPPDVVAQLLTDYENVWVDTSLREYEIAGRDGLDPAWRDLLIQHSDRIMIGSDTWTTSRWRDYEEIIEFDRQWLNQLPRDVAEKI
ncbi:MAG: amidohydrolase family protein, partial [Chloroflexota bacterium]